MVKKVIKIVITILGFLFGYFSVNLIEFLGVLEITNKITDIVAHIGVGLLFSVILLIVSDRILSRMGNAAQKVEDELIKIPTKDLIFGSFGFLLGLIIAYFISQPIQQLPIPFLGSIISTILTVIVYMLFGYLGIRLAVRGRGDIEAIFTKSRQNLQLKEKAKVASSSDKILDTSVIIDARILDIIKTGFIEGSLIIPTFVLIELQHIADSDDNLRRTKGRRGLDILKEIQEQSLVKVIVDKTDFEDIKEVDSKIMELASKYDAKILTNDYNLNKVAGVRGIGVLNINELANAIKPVVIHGEKMTVTVIREGKELNQGLGYLDDGTMIVVEDGKNYIGQTIEVVVTSILQTSAGKMIFAKADN